MAATYRVSGAVVGEWLSAQAGLGYYMIRVKTATRSIKFCCDHLCHSIEFIAEWRLFIIEKKGIIVCFIFLREGDQNEKLWLLLPLLLLLSACGTAKETSSKQEIKDLKK